MLAGARGVVVTGAAQGLGRGIAECLAEAGYAVVGVDLSDTVTEVADALGEGHAALVGDVCDPAVVDRACTAAARLGDGLRAAVFNAGVASPGETLTYPVEEWDRVLGVNLRGVFLGAQAARPHLGAGGSMVMLSSIAAHEGFAARASYCASKSGVDGLVRSLAMEWGPDGVRVNAVAPGTIETEMQLTMIASGRLSTDAALQRVPLGRVGHPHDIGNAVTFLVSDRAGYISGVVLPVDGGWDGGGMPAMASA
jgi:NAD(P)-dependent dehydrogenase (short-subunit alcohol dehydrogenase family)